MVMFSKPYIISFFQSLRAGNFCLRITCEIKSMMAAAITNRLREITKGWAKCNACFVAVEAEPHNSAKVNPATIVLIEKKSV